MKKPLLFLQILLLLCISTYSQTKLIAGRMNEVFRVDTLVAPTGNLRDPWEITYGPDDSLWVTEVANSGTIGYKVRKIHPVSGNMRTILDLTTFVDPASTPTNKWQKGAFTGTPNPKLPQGGLMGLAIHPEFMTNPAKKFVYLAYIHDYDADSIPASGIKVKGYLYRTWVVRFTYNGSQLVSPVALCDTINGGSDHNSGRMIIAPVNGVNYLFYAVGDLGAGQFEEVQRTNNAQNKKSYEGKILRFNLEPDADAGAYDKWIPSSVADPNPFNATLGVQSAVYCYGLRNNQGFAYDPVNDKLYGSSHGPFTDDEINILEAGKNYGHPYVEGYYYDGNYNGSRAATATYTMGSPSTAYPTSVPLITDEVHNGDSLIALGNYKDPLFSAYDAPRDTVFKWYGLGNNNGKWPSEGWSGLGFYSSNKIPGWKGSLVAGSLKWGRLVRLKLDPTGTAVVPTNGADTVAYFQSKNKFRDMAFDPAGDIYTVFDRSPTSSGPSAAPGGTSITPDCAGCVQKYVFLGYRRVFFNNKSTLPTSIPVSLPTTGTCIAASSVTINSDNDTLWVPITGPDGNIIAEIKANKSNLGTITTSVYVKAGPTVRKKNNMPYLNRNITITPQNQPVGADTVNIRLYLTAGELTDLINTPGSGVSSISNLRLLKNSDPCSGATVLATTMPAYRYGEAFGSNYVLQATITSAMGFSTFYMGSGNLTLPLELAVFEGSLQGNSTLLNWRTASEQNTSKFIVERSLNGSDFQDIGSVNASGNSTSVVNYNYTDEGAGSLPVVIVYYRLRMIDIDGGYKYSNIIAISLADIAGKLQVSPNPTEGISKVIMTSDSETKAQWNITDNAGRILMSNSVNLRKGNNTMTINLTKLAAGVYYLNVSGGGINKKVKVQKL